MRTLELPVRWHPTATPPDIACCEPNFEYREAVWPLPAEQTAFVMVDCWDAHPIATHLENSGVIARGVIRPALDACKAAGVTIVHAPSPQQARHYPQWVRYADERDLGFVGRTPEVPRDAWPPAEFRSRTGAYAPFERQQYLRPVAPYVEKRRIVAELEPAHDEYVVATGDQLHRLLRHREILFLLYVGFATNMCVIHRDYGIKAMSQRGYACILLRDGTVGIEAAHTYESRGMTDYAITEVEMLWGVSSTAEALVAALGPR